MKTFYVFSLLSLLLLVPFGSSAQEYPTRPISVVVPYSPGTATDIAARALGRELGKRFGQPIVVQNRPGEVGTVGSQFVAQSMPDGYTLLIIPPALLTPRSDLPYVPAKAFV